jgi:DNA gyrase/topoisomerase IV subunit B
LADSIFANIDRLFGLDKHFFEKIDAEILFFANVWLMEDKNADDKHICQLVIKFFVCHHNINYVLLLFIVA